jgi:hypothetical protein
MLMNRPLLVRPTAAESIGLSRVRSQVVPTAAVLFFFRSIPRTALRCACSPKCFATEVRRVQTRSCKPPPHHRTCIAHGWLRAVFRLPACLAPQAKPSPDETFAPKHPLLLDQQRLAYTDVFTNMDRSLPLHLAVATRYNMLQRSTTRFCTGRGRSLAPSVACLFIHSMWTKAKGLHLSRFRRALSCLFACPFLDGSMVPP